ncbi:Dihydrofolate reductase [Andreprevotia lacus DSM 23236]|jgi:dihydrofolate reductase|uniref:Dihydrofolate reductase n=1 Tax=Andreprevotia lacus DSM 23236 TaxID=1121001 RepID=A0A1W1XLH9_9NEIS|nr:dihydrofolate reductase family protein [Andreprevotia lacus]SMC24830.1 Dihydrofolate reductase [Andreprevotia lacus DSM 23236]
MLVSLYIATSIDGHIAGRDGGLDWLPAIPLEGEDYGYAAYYASIDALVMGRSTYTQVCGMGDWPYAGKQTHVYTHGQLQTGRDDVACTDLPPAQLLARLQAAGHRKVWLMGGANTVRQWLEDGLVDEIILTLVPVVLGEGVPLFSGVPFSRWQLASSRQFADGLVQLHYLKS